MSSTVRIPVSQLETFKLFCIDFSDRIPGRTPLIGRKLYNSFSRSLGHADFNALKQDSKAYGDGEFDPFEVLHRLGDNLHIKLNEEVQAVHKNEQVFKTFPIFNSEITELFLQQAFLKVLVPASGSQCPLLNWDSVIYWHKGEASSNRFVDMPEGCPDNVYALHICDDSMAPEYLHGYYILVDSTQKAKSGDDVIVIHNRLGYADFRRLSGDEERGFSLEPLNDEYLNLSVPFEDNVMTIAGVVVAKRFR